MTYPQKPILLLIALLITLPLIGCEKKTVQRLQVDTTEKPTVRARPCNVLLIGLDSLAVPMERQWAARHETPLTVTKISRKEFEESEMKVGADINVLVYPTDMMVDLIDNKRIDALGKNFYDSDEFNKFSLLKHYRKTGIRFDGQPFAATCGSPMFVQIYRDDLLNAADQTVPVTWEKLIKTQQALTDARSDDSANAVAVPLAAGWAAPSFLAISSPYVRQFGRLSVLFDRNDMKPILESGGFVRALDELKKLSDAHPQSLEMDPASVYQALQSGKAAIGLTWPQANGSEDSPASPDVDQQVLDQLRVAQVPGTAEFFDTDDDRWVKRESGQSMTVNFQNMSGVMASNVRTRGRKRAAEQFMAWLTEPGIGEILFGQDQRSGPFRATHLGKLEAWGDPQACAEMRESWAEVLRQSHEQPLIMTFPKIARSGEYQAILDQGIRKCLLEKQSAEESLAQIAQQWEALTNSIGRRKQIDLLKRNESF